MTVNTMKEIDINVDNTHMRVVVPSYWTMKDIVDFMKKAINDYYNKKIISEEV